MPLIVPVAPMPAAPAPEPSAAAASTSPTESTPRFADALSRAGQSQSAAQGKDVGTPGKPVTSPQHAARDGETQMPGKDSTQQAQGQDPAAASPAAAALAAQTGGVLEAAMAAAQVGKTLPQDAQKADGADAASTPPGAMLAVMLQAPLAPAAAATDRDAKPLPTATDVASSADVAQGIGQAAIAPQGGRDGGADGVAQRLPLWMQGQVGTETEGAQSSRFATVQRAMTTGVDLPTLSTASSSHSDAAPSATSQPSQIGQTLTLGLPATNPAAQSTVPSAVPTPFSSPDWGQAMNQQVLIAAQGQQQFATLHLNPPQLGPLEVHLQRHDGQIQAQFVSQHAVVRQAVEAALPQLRDLFTGAGLSLSQTSVGTQGGQGERQQTRSQRGSSGAANRIEAGGALGASSAQTLRWQQGLVNTYV